MNTNLSNQAELDELINRFVDAYETDSKMKFTIDKANENYLQKQLEKNTTVKNPLAIAKANKQTKENDKAFSNLNGILLTPKRTQNSNNETASSTVGEKPSKLKALQKMLGVSRSQNTNSSAASSSISITTLLVVLFILWASFIVVKTASGQSTTRLLLFFKVLANKAVVS